MPLETNDSRRNALKMAFQLLRDIASKKVLSEVNTVVTKRVSLAGCMIITEG